MQSVKIGKKEIGLEQPVFFIAEGGVNHNGNIDLAFKLIDEAVIAGADCIKFQTFKAENLVTQNAPKADYQLKVTDKAESQFKMLKDLELPFEDYERIIKYCKEKDMLFLSTPYNFEDVDFLDKLDVDAFKIASGQLVEPPFLAYVAKKNKPIILSTGMGYLSDVDVAVRTIRGAGNDQLILLQCVTNYPALAYESNLRAMNTIQQSTGCIVGYSDHTENDVSILGSVALGAKVIEKHFTLDKKMKGPDHKCSADPQELKELIEKVRLLESALGDGIKKPTDSEIANSKGMRRSLVLNGDFKKGHVLQAGDIGFKRPSSEISIGEYEEFLGKELSEDLNKDTILKLKHVRW